MFAPYHLFLNNKRLEDLIEKLKINSHIPQDVYDNYYRYHPALLHKLKSAKYNIDSLEDKLTNTNSQEAVNPESDFIFQINRFIDGFFYCCGSSFDILAREILVLFNITLPTHVYFQTAHTKISSIRPADLILNRLKSSKWKDDFTNYRNTLTHEMIIVSQYSIQVESHGNSHISRILIPLPDNPRIIPSMRTYRHYPDISNYIKESFKRILKMINCIYGDIYLRANSSNSLPL